MPTGIRRLPSGRYQARVKVRGTLYAKGFPAGTPLAEMQAWRQWRRLHSDMARDAPAPASATSTLADDCARYLSAIEAMPSFTDRRRHILDWQAALGGYRPRSSITPVEIRRVLDRWRKTRAPASCNRRRTALLHLWTTLDGRDAPNPVRQVAPYHEPVHALRLPRLEDAIRAIDMVGHTAAHTRQGSRVRRTARHAAHRRKTAQVSAHARGGHASRARLRVLLWTGWPPAQLMRLTPRDVDLTHRVAYVTPRRKGKGSRGRRLPLLPQAVAALRDLDRCDGWGAFSTSSLRSRLHVACDKAGVPRFRVYDLRHVFLSLVASVAKDDRAVAELALHTSPAQTARYTTASVDARISAALDAVAHATFAGPIPQNTAGSGTVTRRRAR